MRLLTEEHKRRISEGLKRFYAVHRKTVDSSKKRESKRASAANARTSAQKAAAKMTETLNDDVLAAAKGVARRSKVGVRNLGARAASHVRGVLKGVEAAYREYNLVGPMRPTKEEQRAVAAVQRNRAEAKARQEAQAKSLRRKGQLRNLQEFLTQDKSSREATARRKSNKRKREDRKAQRAFDSKTVNI